MDKNIFESCLKNRIFEFVNYKQELGYKYISDAKRIRLFDKFLKNINYNSHILTKECIELYIATFTTLAPRSKKCRYGTLKGFSSYLKMFEPKSVVINKNIFRIPPRKKSYIYNKEEIQLLLNSFDIHNNNNQFKEFTNYIITGLLASTGIRCQECLDLNIADFDLKNKLLLIRNGKFGKDRLIPLIDSVYNKINEYLKFRLKHKSNNNNNPLFINKNKNRMSYANYYRNFSIILKDKHIGAGKLKCRKPTIHSLRHSFAVNNILKWIKEGSNVNNMLPYLSTYMGHVSLESTQIYLQSIQEINEIESDKFYQIFKKIFNQKSKI